MTAAISKQVHAYARWMVMLMAVVDAIRNRTAINLLQVLPLLVVDTTSAKR